MRSTSQLIAALATIGGIAGLGIASFASTERLVTITVPVEISSTALQEMFIEDVSTQVNLRELSEIETPTPGLSEIDFSESTRQLELSGTEQAVQKVALEIWLESYGATLRRVNRTLDYLQSPACPQERCQVSLNLTDISQLGDFIRAEDLISPSLPSQTHLGTAPGELRTPMWLAIGSLLGAVSGGMTGWIFSLRPWKINR